MRIRFGTWIHFCRFVSNPGGNSNIINACTSNGLYTIVFDTADEAKEVYNQILVNGYYDASDKEYRNY
ncbi:hypothetical protein [Enterocloster lavalensis]|uniref:hypothetical protein n=1 Tax=Enterocloster lavalensis TaxID=460384 RepID=UPI00206DBF15|nr:hypothetical protein [Enterocloster lavalensis]DAE72591.1 MAG TPA: hypothetical protein [Caudoviricetes sp.]